MNLKVYENKTSEDTLYLKLVNMNNSIYVVTVDEDGDEVECPYVVKFDLELKKVKFCSSSHLEESGWSIE